MFAYRRWFYAAQQHASGRQGPGDVCEKSVRKVCLLCLLLQDLVFITAGPKKAEKHPKQNISQFVH
jgi:hypothetical protein